MPRLHAAALADIPVIRGRTGRIRRLALRDRSFGASGECQDDQERAKSSSPVHYVTLQCRVRGGSAACPRALPPVLRLQLGLTFVCPDCLARFGRFVHMKLLIWI